MTKLLFSSIGILTTLTAFGLPAEGATRDPVFSVPSGTTFPAPQQVALSVPYNGVTRVTTDGTTPNGSSPLYNGPMLISSTTTLKAISIVSSVSSNVVTATYTLDAAKYPVASTGGTTAPVINVSQPNTGQ